MKHNPFSILLIILSTACVPPACAGLSIFDGNTSRDRRDYGLEQRANYRKAKSLNKIVQKEKEAEILYRLKEDDKRKSKILKKNNAKIITR